MRNASVVLLLGALLLSGCAILPATGSAAPPAETRPTVTVIDDVDFGGPDGIRLDVCRPADGATGAPTVLSVHGGGWRGGDKSQPQWREACTWLASQGFVVFQTNYRLAPEHVFPAALADLETALDWIGKEQQVQRFGHDPSRLAAFGDSAGGNLVSLLATGDDVGSAIDAVVELSAPLDLTREGAERGRLDVGFQQVQLDYLGCDSYDDCPEAALASPLIQVSLGDPPFFVVASTDDFIPVEQADAFVAALERDSVEVEFARVESDEHALALLDDDLRVRIAEWLHDRLDR